MLYTGFYFHKICTLGLNGLSLYHKNIKKALIAIRNLTIVRYFPLVRVDIFELIYFSKL